MIRTLAVTLLVCLCACADPNPDPQPEGPPLADGVYEVLGVTTDWMKLPHDTQGTRILENNHAYVEGGAERPMEFVILREAGAAPLELVTAPEEGRMGERPVLLLQLSSSAGDALERLTAKAERAAVVVDGRIVTVHRIRVPIEGGRLQVSC